MERKVKQLSTEIEADLKDELAYYCKKNGYIMGRIIERLIKEYLVKEGVYEFKVDQKKV